MSQIIKFQAFGDDTLLISWKNEISPEVSKDIYLFNQKVQVLIPKTIVESVMSYCSLTLYMKPGVDKIKLISELKKIYHSANVDVVLNSKIWDIPVCYDLLLALDLDSLAKQKNLSIEEVINYHSQTLYTVDFLGFLPGFPYLSGLNPILHTPRLQTPRMSVAKGSIAIGGKQTGIYPLDSPGGWHIIGRTSVDFFDATKPQPCFIQPLDKIKFHSISLEEFNHD